MTPERWQQIKRIFGDALERELHQRGAFLDGACAADVELRAEVETLLREHESGSGLQSPLKPDNWTGRDIGHFQIVEKIGEGGMGVVYRARDRRLDRDVAIKVLPAAVAGDRERVERFRIEARTLAQLNHPNIASIYGVEESGGQYAVVMELVDGPTVADRIRKGAISLDEVLPIARQICEAVEEAHRSGIVHRDLKPANVKLDPEGRVKVLDFGLAKVMHGEVGAEDATGLAPTGTGVVMGTAAYMSPEQARGERVDARSDVWSFGVVLFEMLAGRRPFAGGTASETMAALLKEDPDWQMLPAEVPGSIRHLLARCLRKDRKLRLQSIGEARIAIQEASDSDASDAHEAGKRAAAGNSRVWAIAAATALAGIGIGGAVAPLFRAPASNSPMPPRTFTLTTAPGVQYPAISPDGMHVAYVAGEESTLWIQDLAQPAPREIADTAGAANLFWSPDSAFVGFVALQTHLRKVAVSGGRLATICRLPPPARSYYGAPTWSQDGTFVVLPAGGRLYSVPAAGGEPTLYPDPSRNRPAIAMGPVLLPTAAGNQAMVFATGAWFEPSGSVVLDSGDGMPQTLEEGTEPVYSPTGHILYRARGTSDLWALPFSLGTKKPAGKPFLVAESATSASVAADGTLVYLEPGRSGRRRLTWMNRTGEKLGTAGQPQAGLRYPSLSPDSRLVAVSARPGSSQDIWVHEVSRSAASRLTFHLAPDVVPIWSPDGKGLLYTTQTPVRTRMYVAATDGGGKPRLLLDGPEANQTGWAWSTDGQYVVFTIQGSQRGDVWYLKRKDGGADYEPVPFLTTPFREYAPQLSPDNRLIAYSSDESGRDEIYVREFPGGGGRVPVSQSGGTQPRWNPNGKELFFVKDDTLLAAPVATEPALSIGSPKPLFQHEGLRWPHGSQQYDVASGGQRFLVIEDLEQGTPPRIRVVQNWYSVFRNGAGSP